MPVAFCYLDEDDQTAALGAVLQTSTGWLTAIEGAPTAELYALVESAEAVDLCRVVDSQTLAAWPIGRIFGQRGEVSWRREDGLTHVVLVTDRQDPPAPFAGVLAITAVEQAAATVLLWGNGVGNGVWQEQRLPDPLHYPIHADGAGRRVQLQIRSYREQSRSDDGTVDFVRYVGLELA